MQIKTTIIYHYPPIRMANIYIQRERERERERDRQRETSQSSGYGTTGTLSHIAFGTAKATLGAIVAVSYKLIQTLKI